jgi:hypothetical protein
LVKKESEVGYYFWWKKHENSIEQTGRALWQFRQRWGGPWQRLQRDFSLWSKKKTRSYDLLDFYLSLFADNYSRIAYYYEYNWFIKRFMI